MTGSAGGCLCGNLRYQVDGPPDWVTICFCSFCQRATGGHQMTEPIFPVDAFRMTKGIAKVYTHISGGSGQEVYVHFCPECGTKTHLTFQRWPDRLGVYSGSFDDPGWFEISPENTKFIFLEEAPRGTLVPAGYKTYRAHAALPDGTPLDAEILSEVLHIRA
jgi:hypothetical protein